MAVNLGHYDEAAEHFSKAYGLTQDPALLFSLAQTYRLAGKPEKALATYSAFLRAADSNKKYRVQIERATSEIESITSFVLNNRPVDRQSTPAIESEQRLEPVAKNDLAPPLVVERVPDAKVAPEPKETKLEPPMLVPAPEPAPTPAMSFTSLKTPVAESPPPSAPVYKRWWFWTGVAGALALGGAATWATWHYSQPNNQPPPSTYGALRVLP